MDQNTESHAKLTGIKIYHFCVKLLTSMHCNGLNGKCDDFLSCCLENHFCKNEERGQQGGGTVGAHWNSNDLTKKESPNFTKMSSIKNSTISHIWFALFVLSPPESIELLKYPLLPSTLILPSFFLKEFRIRVLI